MFSLCYSITLILTGVNRCRLKLTEITEMNVTVHKANFAWIFACYWNGVNSNK
ncbi:hypothetical protein IMSAG025_00344 [Muribaculaceae bacterium]|nr:hypothetical protein IMSAG025_00344 [Muribaculaceae bacterium]